MLVHDRKGFALPMTLFLISLLTLMLTAAFTKVQSDRRVGNSSGANVDALGIAKAGVQQYMGTRVARPADGDSVRITVGSGYADVIAKVIRKPIDTLANWTFVIRGVGHVIDPAQGADPQAIRTIAQFAQWQTGRIDVLAAFTAANNLSAAAGSGQFNGAGESGGLEPCGAAMTYAVRVPNPLTATSVTTSYTTTGIASGTYAAYHMSSSGTNKQTADATNIDWEGLIGGGLSPDYTSATTVRVNASDYASQIVTGNGVLNDPAGGSWTLGTGLLIVAGDLTIQGEQVQWNGIVLVGGRILFNALDQRFDGLVVSGLNAQSGATVAAGTLGTGNVDIDYDTCYMTTSLARLTGFAPITNGWVDNWAAF